MEQSTVPQAVPQEQQEKQIQTLAENFIEALHSLEDGSDEEADQLAMLYSEDAILTNAALELGNKKIEGRDAIMRFWVEYKAELGQSRSKFHHITTSDHAAGLFWTTEGQSPKGETVHYHGVSLLEFDEMGLIKFFRGYYDTRELTVKAAADDVSNAA